MCAGEVEEEWEEAETGLKAARSQVGRPTGSRLGSCVGALKAGSVKLFSGACARWKAY